MFYSVVELRLAGIKLKSYSPPPFARGLGVAREDFLLKCGLGPIQKRGIECSNDLKLIRGVPNTCSTVSMSVFHEVQRASPFAGSVGSYIQDFNIEHSY